MVCERCRLVINKDIKLIEAAGNFGKHALYLPAIADVSNTYKGAPSHLLNCGRDLFCFVTAQIVDDHIGAAACKLKCGRCHVRLR
ncbi:hypothetical protein GCM10011507_02800 [Edaphobacter acidisoli]|uniref:Uncharacterized protein n=1 Tax=Edaphobacter acidisoli TaxID=2040573 RepID=A0A916VZH0_9BACT|nr:hypothetical protein GCM10011507_02800 [Edaphobacter acidisoli]